MKEKKIAFCINMFVVILIILLTSHYFIVNDGAAKDIDKCDNCGAKMEIVSIFENEVEYSCKKCGAVKIENEFPKNTKIIIENYSTKSVDK